MSNGRPDGVSGSRTVTALRDRVRAVLALGVVLGLGAVGTMAAWTDQSTATSGAFSTGTVDLKVGDSPAADNDPADFTTTFAMANMAPGTSRQATLVVHNAGTVPFTYTLASVATNSGAGADQLGAAMELRVYAGQSCSGTVINTPASLHQTAFATPASRPLAAEATEWLCFRATVPGNADTALQGRSTVATFTLTATSS